MGISNVIPSTEVMSPAFFITLLEKQVKSILRLSSSQGNKFWGFECGVPSDLLLKLSVLLLGERGYTNHIIAFNFAKYEGKERKAGWNAYCNLLDPQMSPDVWVIT